MPEAEAASRAIQIVVGCQLRPLDFTWFRRHISTPSYQTFTTVRYWPKPAILQISVNARFRRQSGITGV